MKLLKKVASALAVATIFAAGSASADEVVLRAVNAFQPGSVVAKPFERFVEHVNKEGKGLVQINLIGGPSAIPPFEIGNAVSSGVVDMAYVTSAFYPNLLPEGAALKLTERTMSELRENGGWEFINELHNKKMNVWFLGRSGVGQPFHLYVNKPVDKADLSGLTLRVTPVYRSFFEKLGANAIQTPPSEVYTTLERGVADGYGWPIQGILDLGWHEVTKARVDPGFYQVDVNALVNLDKWNSLTDEQRAFLTEMGLWLEGLNAENAAINEAEKKKQADAGMVVYELTGAEREKWINQARETGWAEVEEVAPESAARLRELLAKE
ncbi:TRAP transporter substrate-binding protein DctP [Neopusillimonas maritima]|uniref:ABC transporter substrate-binding protein n=1 Tax=Neopusillimonas maritima TaxID=2026239 RepID=A0A3A1YSP9_9BURK|nr:TRAP transporter substrate-binding protein DctP [Neopusillimonas maritima]RIY39424.1 ABC transporter substrate-binding protein [Neopusillimonas maritima]